MYDYDLDLPFAVGLNLETFVFILNIGIPIVYFANFFYLLYKLRGMDKEAPFYSFIRSLVYFFFFYGLGAIFFVWYDYFYMDFESPNPIFVWWGLRSSPPLIAIHLWKIGILLTTCGLVIMVFQLRKKIFKKKLYYWLPIVWELLGITMLILIGFVPLPIIGDHPYFYAEIIFLFIFTWSISLPLTYSYIWKNAAGKMRRYAGILFASFIGYGIAWGFRTRFAVHMSLAMFSIAAPPFNIFSSYQVIWLVRSASIVFSLSMVLYAYSKLLGEF